LWCRRKHMLTTLATQLRHRHLCRLCLRQWQRTAIEECCVRISTLKANLC
jgi:hypothetical protein